MNSIENPYNSSWKKTSRELRESRDCAICGESDFEKKECHHIDFVKSNDNPENIIVLCKDCHHEVHEGRIVIPRAGGMKEEQRNSTMLDTDGSKDILTRTFGIEIEMCDFDRSKVVLPPGFEWNKEEGIFNTDGMESKFFGGEINTPPSLFCEESFEKIKSVYDQINAAGGRLKWSIDTHVHLYAGDLTLEQLKQLVVFQYCTYPYFKQYTGLGEWDEVALHGKPLMTEAKFLELKNAVSLSDLRRALTNQSKKGFVRYAINVASVFVRNTIEFRCYNATHDFELVKNCVDATYKMFYYALSHTEEEFLSIGSYEEFVERLSLPANTPPLLVPLIYQGNPYSAKEAFMTKPIRTNSRLSSALCEALDGEKITEVAIVNSLMFQYELNLWKKFKITSYNQDPYSHLLYRLSKGEVRISYKDKLEWIEKLNSDDPVRQVAIALYVFKLAKHLRRKDEFNKGMVSMYKEKAEESIAATEQSAKRLVEMLNSIDYVNGNLADAIEKDKAVFFSFGRYGKTRTAVQVITKNSDYEDNVVDKRDDYYELVERIPAGTYFYMFSGSPYLSNMHKIAIFKNFRRQVDRVGTFLYCNIEHGAKKASIGSSMNLRMLSCINLPPDDLDVSDPSKLDILKITTTEMMSLQQMFVKKVDKVGKAKFAYAIMYDKYLLGAAGFDYHKNADFDVFQVSDFCTNNNIPRLSKLILMCILSKKMQRILSRALVRKTNTVLTHAYTDAPVSMKYRGLYSKEKEMCKPHRLSYSGVLGKYSSVEEIVKEYQKIKQNAGKN